MASQNGSGNDDGVGSIPKLEGGSNYHEWSYDAEMVLRGRDLWHIVDGTEILADGASTAARRAFEARSSLALSIITRTLQRGPKMLVYSLRDPKAIWTKLQDDYQPKGRYQQVSLRQSYIKLLANTAAQANMSTYLTEVKVVVDKLSAIGVNMDDETVTLDLLASLPPRFNTLVTALSAQKDIPARSFVQEKILQEEARIADQEDKISPSATALAVGQKPHHHQNNNNAGTSTSDTAAGEPHCDWCGMANHYAHSCRRRQHSINLVETFLKFHNLPDSVPGNNNRPSQDRAAIAFAAFDPAAAAEFTFDSAAEIHDKPITF